MQPPVAGQGAHIGGSFGSSDFMADIVLPGMLRDTSAAATAKPVLCVQELPAATVT